MVLEPEKGPWATPSDLFQTLELLTDTSTDKDITLHTGIYPIHIA